MSLDRRRAPEPGDRSPFSPPETRARPAAVSRGERSTSRDGPPWETGRGPLPTRFFATALGVLLRGPELFGRLRIEGGLAMPTAFAVIGLAIGFGVAGAIRWLLRLAVHGWRDSLDGSFLLLGGLLLMLSIVGVVVGSGLVHAIVWCVERHPRPFEATFRALAYTAGSTGLTLVIPFCGDGIIMPILTAVIGVIGVWRTHEIALWKATLAVLLPLVVGCGGTIAAGMFWLQALPAPAS